MNTNSSPQLFGLNRGLLETTRLRAFASESSTVSIRDWLILLSAGVAAACVSTFFDFGLRIPGHAILRAIFPMAVGLALVPRHGAGCVTGAAAAATAGALRLRGIAGDGLSLGALTSLVATGPLLDWTVRHTHGGWRLYGAFTAAGLASNLVALAVRGTAKVIGWEHASARPLGAWLAQASITYTLCGIVAGLLSSAVWFYARRVIPHAADEGGDLC